MQYWWHMRVANVAWSLVGLGGPLIVAALTVPSLIEIIGMDRFGLLGLAWGLLGLSGMFDLGIGRATTLTVARMRGSAELGQVPLVLRIAVRMSMRAGLVGACALAVTIAAGLHRYIKFPPELSSEVPLAAYLLALSIPAQVVMATFRGVNEAFEQFRDISFVRIGLGVANFLGPFCMALYTSHLAALVATLVLSRFLALYCYRRIAYTQLKKQMIGQVPSNDPGAEAVLRHQMLSFGGWFTVSCLVSPLITQSDRFFIGNLVSTHAIAAYTIPFEVITQALVISGAISSVAFPSLSKLWRSNPVEAQTVFNRWLLRLAAIMSLLTIFIATVLPTILPLWIGAQLPAESVMVGQLLCIGVFGNSIGAMYFASLHAKGRADVTAKLHVLELPIFAVALYLLITHFGVLGAAITWSGRMILDALLLWLAHAGLHSSSRGGWKS